jgi:hypothetical protein
MRRPERPNFERRLRETEPDDAFILAEWGNYQLTVARTQDLVPEEYGGDDGDGGGDPKVLGFLALEVEHLVDEDGVPPFLQTIYLPDPVADQLMRQWLNIRANESDTREQWEPSDL